MIPRIRRGGTLQMALAIHPLVQYAHHHHGVIDDAVIHHMLFHPLPPVAGADVIATRPRARRLCERLKSGVQRIQIAPSLRRPPLPYRVAPNAFKVAQRRWGQPEFSHAQPSFAL